eukprot:UN07233
MLRPLHSKNSTKRTFKVIMQLNKFLNKKNRDDKVLKLLLLRCGLKSRVKSTLL